MVNVKKLKEEELNQLNDKSKVELGEEEWNLEELILLGDDKKIPIIIEYPRPDGTSVKGKALVKQLTMKEIEGIQVENANNLIILQKALFQSNGEPFKLSALKSLPIGVANEIVYKIFELSGVDIDELRNF